MVVIHLLNSSRVQSFQHLKEKMEKSCSDSVVDMSEICFRVVNNIVCKVSLGKTYREQNFMDLLKRFVHVLGLICIGNYIPWLSWIDRLSGLEDKAKKVAKDFDAFLESVVDEHEYKRQRIDGQSDDEDKDLVDILLGIQRDDTIGFTLERDTIKGIILDVFAAGTDTIFASLVWSLSELIRHPRVMKNLQQEVTEIAQGRSMILERDLKNMHYLKAIIKETLRLYPPGPLLSLRKSMQDVKLMGYDIPSGTQTIVNVWAIGRDPTVWEEPEKFWPERFLNNCIDYKGLHFEMLPFGAGRRGCPGIQFAIAIYELALANVIYKFNLTLPNGVRDRDLDMSEADSITLHKKSPLLVIATPRF